MGAINGIEWNIKAASKGTLWVHVIGRAQASVYMGVSWAINPIPPPRLYYGRALSGRACTR